MEIVSAATHLPAHTSPHLEQPKSNELAPTQPITIVTLSSAELSRKIRSGFFNKMKPCVYHPASNTFN